MYIKYDDDGKILSMSGEKLEEKNCIEITSEMVDKPFEKKSDAYFDIKKKKIFLIKDKK